MSFKYSNIFFGWVESNNSLRQFDLKYLLLLCSRCLQSIRMCFTDSRCWQWEHLGCSFPVSRYWWVSFVCPMCIRCIMTSSLRFKLQCFLFIKVGLVSCSLFDVSRFQAVCHLFWMYTDVWLCKSEYVLLVTDTCVCSDAFHFLKYKCVLESSKILLFSEVELN